MVIANINVQSLKARSGDIETDSVLQKWDYFACSETWMRDESAVQISVFECVAKRNNRSQGKRTTGGVTIYRNLQSVSTCRQLVTLDRRIRLTDKLVGDFCMVNVTIDQVTKFILGAVYIHPNVPQESIDYFMFQMLDNVVARYRKTISQAVACFENGSFAIAFNRVFSVCTFCSASPLVGGRAGTITIWKIPIYPQYNLTSHWQKFLQYDTMTCG
jgi:hypothetical protein